MKTLVYLYFAGIFLSACTQENKVSVKSNNGFHIEEPIKILSRNYYCFIIKLSKGNLETAVTNDQTLYDLLKMTRNFKDIGDFKMVRSGIAKDSMLISENVREDTLLKRFFVIKDKTCSISSYEETLKKNELIEIPGKDINNCLIYEFCKRGYSVNRDDESGMYIIKKLIHPIYNDTIPK